MDDCKAMDAAPEGLKNFLKAKMSAEDYGKACDMMDAMRRAHDEEIESERKAEDEEREAERAERADDGEHPDDVNSEQQSLEDRKMRDGKRMDDRGRAHDSMAMDAAQVRAEVERGRVEERKLQQAIYDARVFVRPWVGELATIAFDSAEGVFEKALSLRNVQTRGIHPSAFKALLQAQPKPDGAKVRQTQSFASDGSSATAAAKYAPGVERIRIGA
jgi:hypothetical protein